MKNLYTSLSLISLAFILVSCINDEAQIERQFYYPEELAVIQQTLNLPATPLSYNVDLPAHIASGGLFARPIHKDKATLGRVLFYDKALSSTGDISCASCHDQAKAFSDGKALSEGVNNSQTDRNSLALGSVVSFVAYYGNSAFGGLSGFSIPFMWDNRFATAAEQAKAALTDPKEMGLTTEEFVSIISNKNYYPPLFRRAFGDKEINEARILEAISEFIDGLGTFDSKFDKAALEVTVNGSLNFKNYFPGLTTSENIGKSIYMNNCASCHSTSFGRPMLTSANNGLDMQYTDEGIGGITGDADEKGLFKVPTLRNIAVTGPYMHDGRFGSLEEVVEFYSDNIANHPRLSSELRDHNGQPMRLNLSDSEKAGLVNFLSTLTDFNYLEEERYSDPFK